MARSGDWQWDYDFFVLFMYWHGMSSPRMLNQLGYSWSFSPAEWLQNWVLEVVSKDEGNGVGYAEYSNLTASWIVLPDRCWRSFTFPLYYGPLLIFIVSRSLLHSLYYPSVLMWSIKSFRLLIQTYWCAQFTYSLFSPFVGLKGHLFLKKIQMETLLLIFRITKIAGGYFISGGIFHMVQNWAEWFNVDSDYYLKKNQTNNHINSNLDLANIKQPERFMWIHICRLMHIILFGLHPLTCTICSGI